MNKLSGIVFNAKDLVKVQEGAIVSKTIVDRAEGTITAFAFAAGQALSEHSAPYDALVHVIEGHLTIYVDKEPNQVEAGNCILLPSDIPHSIDADVDGKMILTMIRG